ncbi:hypothetical protein [Aquabacterium sp.]|uniref:hypothetical protein n=1 Tax=Aquabacterium sp. TaxID=1872578 RepID=UPI002487868A|nr:hypothetical protein [Aquabacterium sp.]MDI1260103.1 hypothetical protein [Aquabacterium sp.]
MVKRALLVLAIAGVLVWWYERGQGPEVDAGKASVPQAVAGLEPTPPTAKGAVVRPAGGWAPKAWSVLGGKLVPGRALRERFDSYLPLGKGVTMVEVRATLEQDAQADLGQANSVQVLAIWDRYARLQNHDWQHPFNGSEPKGWQATLNEQHRVRRQWLGADWAEAFFGEDEAALQRRIANLVASPRQPAASSLDDVLSKAPASAGVVASAASGARGDWRARAGKAGQEWAHLMQDASLDEGQRLIRIRLYLQQNFSGPEAARLERDLQLP